MSAIILSGGKILGSGSNIFLIPVSGGGTPPAAPTNVLMTLQGLDAPDPSFSHNITPGNPNKTQIGWTQGVPASGRTIAGNKVYRNTTGQTGPWGAAYFDSSSTPITSFTDGSATGCVSGTQGTGPPGTPWYNPTATYWYAVTSIDDQGQESAKSSTQAFILYQNGTFNGGPDLSYSSVVNYNVAGQGVGGGAAIGYTPSAPGGGFQPTVGNLTTTWNMPVGAFTNLEFDMKAPTSNRSYITATLIAGDKQIYNSGGSQIIIGYGSSAGSFGPATIANTYVHIKIPLATIMTDHGSGGGTPSCLELAFYKFFVSDQTGTGSTTYFDNIMFTP